MIRLNKVLRELNISLDKAITICSELGYQVESRPTTKIDEELHELLKKKLNFIPPPIFDNNLITTPKFINEAREKQGGHPRSVYKYYSLTDYNFDSIENKYLYYPKPSDFNDPFDCSKELISFINENSKNKTRHKKKEKIFSESLNNIGICCFSRTKDSILMWSHYASKHQGFCVEYITHYDNYGINPLDINYVLKFKKAQYFEKAQRAIFHLIYTKSNEWKYEQELRASLIEVQTDEGRKVSFREKEILSIYFGINCKEKTINKLKGIIEKNYSNNIIFYKGIMSKNDFKIKWLEH
jgi:hypothetical protein